jgi:hypothetical protein
MAQSVVHLQRQLNELEERLKHATEPTYAFKPGDKVRVGNLQDSVVEDVLHDGKIYLIDFTNVETNYGKPVRSENQKKYVSWVQVRKHQEEPRESIIHNADLNLRFSYRMLSELLNKVYHFGVKFDPDYQRGYEWDMEDKILLIDSIFNNIDIGKFALVQYDAKTWVKSGNGFEILDGKQRLHTLLDFYEDRFEWRGRTFSDLSSRDQNHFTGYPVLFAELKELSREKILRYFLQLNTFGKVMGQDHLTKVKEMLDDTAQ